MADNERNQVVEWLEHKAASCEEEARCCETEAETEEQYAMARAYHHAADCVRRGVHADEEPEDDPSISAALKQIDEAFGR